MFTYDELKNLVPKKQKSLITQTLVDTINSIASDDTIAEEFRQNFITHSMIINTGKYSMEEYKNAIHFVTMLLLETSDIDAYAKTFPKRYMKLVAKGLDRPAMGPYVSMYKNTHLVTKILEQTLVPSHILNAPLYQEAINHNKHLMLHARSEMVQHQAAKTLMENLKPPEAAKLEVEIGIKRNESVEENEAFMLELAAKKIELMKLGGNVKDIANMTVANEEIIEIEEV